MKIIAVTQARMGSSRLPKKVLKQINGISLLQCHLERALLSQRITKLKVATTNEADVTVICNIATRTGVEYYCGNTEDVLDRFYQTVKNEKADYIVRLTSDCPLIDPGLIDQVIDFTMANNLDYASNTLFLTFPDGTDVEVFSFRALKQAWTEATLLSDREHVTPYIWRNSTFKGGHLFKSDNFSNDIDYSKLRLTVDEDADYQLIKLLVNQLGTKASWKEYVQFLLNNPQFQTLNQHIQRNEGYIKSLLKDQTIK